MKDNLSEIIAGYQITTQDRNACVSKIVDWIKSGEMRRYFLCANPHSLEVGRSDPFFKEAISNADMAVPDGIGVVIASRIQNGAIRARVTGSDIFLGLSHALNQQKGYRYFFLGSTEKTLDGIRERMGTEYPNIEIAGTFSPPFKPEFHERENRAMVAAVNETRPHVLWVGMTAPKQEKWIYQHREQLDVHFIGAVGAVFDFYAGTAKRSGQWFQDHGYEWLPRLLREPRRLWYRNFVSFPMFILRNVVIRLANSKHGSKV